MVYGDNLNKIEVGARYEFAESKKGLIKVDKAS